VLLQHNAGIGVGISDDDYRKAGATILEGAKAFSGGTFNDDACLLLARQ